MHSDLALKDLNPTVGCLDMDREGGVGVGVDFHAISSKKYFSAFLKKKTFLTPKGSTWQISVNSEQLGKSLQSCHIGPACTDLFNWKLKSCMMEFSNNGFQENN